VVIVPSGGVCAVGKVKKERETPEKQLLIQHSARGSI
jgi:hypothetical protein